jgi:hypothetical protein
VSPARRQMRRVGDLLPEAARELGLEDELRLGRAAAAFERVVAEHVPAAAGSARLLRISGSALLVEVDHPLVGQELRLRSTELLEAFSASPAGVRAGELRIVGTRR